MNEKNDVFDIFDDERFDELIKSGKIKEIFEENDDFLEILGIDDDEDDEIEF